MQGAGLTQSALSSKLHRYHDGLISVIVSKLWHDWKEGACGLNLSSVPFALFGKQDTINCEVTKRNYINLNSEERYAVITHNAKDDLMIIRAVLFILHINIQSDIPALCFHKRDHSDNPTVKAKNSAGGAVIGK